MVFGASGDAWRLGPARLLVLVVLFVVFLLEVAIFVKIFIVLFFFLEIFVIFLELIQDGIQRHRMSLRYLQFGLAFGTAEDLSLLNLVFVHVYFCGAFWAANHGPSSDLEFAWYTRNRRGLPIRRIIYLGEESQPEPLSPVSSVTQQLGCEKNRAWRENTRTGQLWELVA